MAFTLSWQILFDFIGFMFLSCEFWLGKVKLLLELEELIMKVLNDSFFGFQHFWLSIQFTFELSDTLGIFIKLGEKRRIVFFDRLVNVKKSLIFLVSTSLLLAPIFLTFAEFLKCFISLIGQTITLWVSLLQVKVQLVDEFIFIAKLFREGFQFNRMKLLLHRSLQLMLWF